MPAYPIIDERPKIIDERKRIGDWEIDTIIGKQQKQAVVSIVERVSKKTILKKVSKRTAIFVADATIESLKKISESVFSITADNVDRKAEGTALAIIKTVGKIKQHVKSITFDQGSEFKKYSWIQKCLDADIYFCEPSSPYQKGAIENSNGIMRVEYPRIYNISAEKQKNLNNKTEEINNRPLKCLDYQSPAEVFNQLASIKHEN